MGFPRTVQQYPAAGVEGDFASANIRANTLAGEGAFVAGENGLTVGRFAWIDNLTKKAYNRNVNGRKPDGFVARQIGSAIIVIYLAEASNLIAQGSPVTLHDEGDFRIKCRGQAADIGVAIYADNETGEAYVGAAPAGTTGTGSIGATFTATAGSPDTTQLVVTAVTGYISPGDTVAGTGIPAGRKVVSQVSGTTGGAGTYQLDGANTASAATITAFGSVLHVTAASGSFDPGDTVSGTGVPTGSAILSQIDGTTGGVGNYRLDAPATAYAASTALTVAAGVQTNFVVGSIGAVNDLIKMTTWGKL